MANPVPFDAIRKTDIVKNGGNPHINGFNHRYTAIGHDPLIGLVFGTANIMTKTITVAKGNFNFETYHVGSRTVSNGYAEYMMDHLTNHADTNIMFQSVFNRIMVEGKDGWEALLLSLGKEVVHLMSDARTAKSLPIPVVSVANPDTSRILNLCGIDALSVGMYAVDRFVSHLINVIIAYLHTLCYNPDTDGDETVYGVRTRNIIYYSSEISITSSVIKTLFRAYCGDTAAISKFDFGGTVTSIKAIWKIPLVISEIKSEYIRNKVATKIKEA